MTTARLIAPPPAAMLGPRLVLACALAGGCGAVSAASIGELPTTSYGEMTNEDSFGIRRLDDDTAPAPAAIRSSSDVDKVLRSLRIHRPDMQDDVEWFDDVATQPLALQPETLLRGSEDDIWLSEHDTTRHAGSAPGLRDLLRSIVNVSFNDASMEHDAGAPTAVPYERRYSDPRTGSDLLRDIVVGAIEPYRRADGSVGFSVFGVGDFYAEADRGLRGVRLVEANTGFSFDYQRADGQAATRRSGPDDDLPQQAAMLSAETMDATRIDPSQLHVAEALRETWRWLKHSLLVRFLLAAFALLLIGRALLRLGRSLQASRRDADRLHPRQPAMMTEMALAGGLPEAAEASSRERPRRRRRRRRRGRSPTLRNLLRSLGLG